MSPPAVSQNIITDFLKKIDQYSDSYTSLNYRPKNSNNINLASISEIKNINCAIVIQGPIIVEEDFTIETIKLYKKNFPTHTIIVSTWNDLSEDLVEKITSLKIVLILNEKPHDFGPLNINLQIESTKKGLEKAKELGVTYAYKTRTDQRFYKNGLTEYFLQLLKTFPLKETNNLNNRLIACSFTTLKYRPYGIGDMFMFGQIDDMLNYWSADFDFRQINKQESTNLTSIEYAKLRLAETYLCANFLERINYSLEWTLKDSWNVYGSFFCVVDKENIDLFWYKYEWRDEKRFDKYDENSMNCLKFSDWLIISNNESNSLISKERILQKPEGSNYNV